MGAGGVDLAELGVIDGEVLVGDVVVGIDGQGVGHEGFGISPVAQLAMSQDNAGDHSNGS